MLVPSTMLPLGTKAPMFALPDTKDRGSLKTFADLSNGQITVLMFICNHCPYVQHILPGINALIAHYSGKGVAWVAISSNDIKAYPEDDPEHMKDLPIDCPYLYDATQEVAKAYQAACTPDFYLFDTQSSCIYRGRFDASMPGRDVPVTGQDLAAAIDAALEGKVIVEDEQKPSMGLLQASGF